MAAVIIVFAFACVVRFGLARHALLGDAHDEYRTRERDKPATIKGIERAQFVQIYLSSHLPRWTLYTAGGVMAALLITPLAVMIVVGVYTLLWTLSGAPDWGDRTGYVYMFSVFFGLCFIWAGVAAIAARLLHQRRPEPFHHALARARGEPIEGNPNWRRRPKWARKVRPDPPADDEAEG